MIGFYGQGVPVDTEVPANGDTLSTPASGDPTLATNVAPAKDSTVELGTSNYPDFSHDRTYSFGADVTPTITDPGTGAEATASVDPKTGAISGVTVTSPGAGYAVPPTVKITTAGVTPTTVAKATAKIATGVITSIDVNETGLRFHRPIGRLSPAAIRPRARGAGPCQRNGRRPDADRRRQGIPGSAPGGHLQA